MKVTELERILHGETEEFREVESETWSFVAHGVPMQLFTNAAKDRMRVLATVSYSDDLSMHQLRRMLRTNFQSDARYGLHDGVLYSLFAHSLSGLCASDLRSALRQIAQLVRSYGTTYSTGSMRFQWPRPKQSDGNVRRRTIEAVQGSLPVRIKEE